MPTPKPKEDESKSVFIKRCTSNQVMIDEYSNEKQRLAVCAANFSADFKSNQTYSWDVEVFAVGKWNGIPVNEQMIDSLIANFSALKNIHTPPLKFGHNEKQPIQAIDGQMALGWVDKVWKGIGEKGVQTMFATFTDVPEIIYNIIKAKRFKNVSIELLFDAVHKGIKYNYVLDAVALLGADKPAVNIIADMTHYMSERSNNLTFSKMESFSIYESFKTTKESTMDIDQNEYDRLKAVEASHATLVRTSAESEAKFTADLEVEKKINLTAKANFARDGIIAVLDAGVTAMQITPAQKVSFSTMLGVDDDKKVVSIDLKTVKDFVEQNKASPGEGSGLKTGDGVKFTETTAGDIINQKVQKLQVDSGMKLSYSDALSHVYAVEPELAKAHLSATGQE